MREQSEMSKGKVIRNGRTEPEQMQKSCWTGEIWLAVVALSVSPAAAHSPSPDWVVLADCVVAVVEGWPVVTVVQY